MGTAVPTKSLPLSKDRWSSIQREASRGNPVAKGHLCPVCDTYTLQRISTNWVQCTTCGLKKQI